LRSTHAHRATPRATARAPRTSEGVFTFGRAAPDELAAAGPLPTGVPLGAEVELALGVLVSLPLTTPFCEGVVAAPFVCGLGTEPLLALAAARNWSYGFCGVALMENTMPAWQWFAGLLCRQKNQRGLVSVKENDQVGNVEELAATGTKPEEIPTTLGVTEVFVNCVQGSGKLDCVTV